MMDKPPHPELTPIFAKLRAILQKHEKSYSVIDNAADRYGLGGPPGPATLRAWRGKVRKPILPLAWVEIGKSSVTYHLMGMEHPSLAKGVSKALSARLQGKTCFHFQRDEPALFDELELLTVKGLAGMKKAGFI